MMGTLKSFSPHMNRVGVRMRSAWKNGNEMRIHLSAVFQGSPISSSYWRMYWSLPYIDSCRALPAPLTPALNRVSVAMV